MFTEQQLPNSNETKSPQETNRSLEIIRQDTNSLQDIEELDDDEGEYANIKMIPLLGNGGTENLFGNVDLTYKD